MTASKTDVTSFTFYSRGSGRHSEDPANDAPVRGAPDGSCADPAADSLPAARASIVAALRAVPARLRGSLGGPRADAPRPLAQVLADVAAQLLDATAETREDWATRIALQALQEAALSGETEAAFRLASLYLSGSRVARDLDKACLWFARASLDGNVEAAFMLGLINQYDYEPARGRAALGWYRAAMRRGHRGAASFLGLLVDEGRLVPRDVGLAEQAFLTGAAMGDMEALFFLAGLYHRERALDPDFRRCFGWYAIAAEAGHGLAASTAALMLQQGLGTPRNLGWARRLAEMAVERGVTDADRLIDSILSDIVEARFEQAPGVDVLAPATVH